MKKISILILPILLILVLLPTLSQARDNKDDEVIPNLKEGGWEIAMGKHIDHWEYGKLLLAMADISGTSISTYFTDLFTESVAELGKNIVITAIKNRGKTFGAGQFEVQAGIATYDHWHGENPCSIFGGECWTKFNEPNTHQPYVRWRRKVDDQKISGSTKWQHIGHANDITAIASLNGVLYAATKKNNLWLRDPNLFEINWRKIGHANNVVAMAGANGQLYAATSDNKLWVRSSVQQDTNWKHIGHANNVVSMAAINDELYAATSDNKLWVRSSVQQDTNWKHIGHANNVTGMAAINGILYVVTNDGKLWRRSPVHHNVDWTHIDYAPEIVSMAGSNGRLFSATRDNKLLTFKP